LQALNQSDEFKGVTIQDPGNGSDAKKTKGMLFKQS